MKKPDNILKQDWNLLVSKYRNLDKITNQINNDYPIQYLIGNVDFYGYKILVNKNVLIPRFETEMLVEKSCEYIKKLNLCKGSLLDVGTGSGCISIALKKEIQHLNITAIDISAKALILAKKNAKQHKVAINFIHKDMFKYDLLNKYDILISNPPYIAETDIIDRKTSFEPKIALYGGKDGLKCYKQLFKIAKMSLSQKFLIALEIDEDRSKDIYALAKETYPKSTIIIEKDLNQKDRYIFIY